MAAYYGNYGGCGGLASWATARVWVGLRVSDASKGRAWIRPAMTLPEMDPIAF